MICEGKQYQIGKSVTFDSISERNSTREKKKRRQKPMKQKPNKTNKQKAEEPKAVKFTDQEHDMKKDLSFFRFPSSVKKEREEYGHYDQPNY